MTVEDLLAEVLPGPSGLAGLLGDAEAFIRRFVVLSDAQAAACALWAAHTHAIEAAECTPYLSALSPEKRSGKTRLLETLELLAANPLRTVNVSEAALFRVIAQKDAPRPTLLVDEADAIFNPRSDRDELRGLLNAGYRRGAVALRADKSGAVHRFDAFGAKILAGIGSLPDTIADRCIPIAMRRRAPDEAVQRFRLREAAAEAEPIRAGLSAWACADGVLDRLRAARPEIPARLDDRAADGWEPLLAIADVAGDSWPEVARAAAAALHDGEPSEESLGVTLLGHIREAFDGRDRIATDKLLRVLVERDDAPWAIWWAADVDAGRLKGPAARVARLLRAFEAQDGRRIRSVKLKIDGRAVQGFRAADFADAWVRYCGSVLEPENLGTSEPRRSEPVSGFPAENAEMPADQGSSDVPSFSALSMEPQYEADPDERPTDAADVPCVRCDRYGVDHSAAHIRAWEDVADPRRSA